VGFFNYHGQNGIKKAERLVVLASRQIDEASIKQTVVSFFRNEIKDIDGILIGGGINSHKHSFISFFINEVKKYNFILNMLGLTDIKWDDDYTNDQTSINLKRKRAISQLVASSHNTEWKCNSPRLIL
jgi:hypothetical protein